jgi:DNA polymerase (family 10)
MAEFLEMEEVAFKPRAYEKAALSVEALKKNIKEIYKKGGIKALEEIPGIGKGIAERIEELFKTGKISDYEKFKKKMPINIRELTSIEGIGPKIVKILYKKLKIKNIKDLKKAAKAGRLKNLPHFGEKLEQKILKGIEFHDKSKGRFLLGKALFAARTIKKKLQKLPEVEKIEFAGSLRRWKETIGDIDMLAASKNAKKVMDYFANMPEVSHIYAKGKTKTMARLNLGIDADLRVVGIKSFGSALQYFTGNKNHNIRLRKIAIKKRCKLNEYGLFKNQQNDKLKFKNKPWKQIAGDSEKEIYNKLGMDWVPPEIRRNDGEIEAAQKHKLPKLVKLNDIKGDLQVQTNWTDGENSILEMAEEAKKIGYEYIVITDHTKSLAMTGGSDEKKLLRQMKEIEKANRSLKVAGHAFKVLSGAEVNILKDGSLDISNEILKKLDFVGAAVHSYFHLPKKEQTNRLIKAMRNPHVDIIFHPTGRVLHRRPEIELDINEILKAAKQTKTFLEINAFPDRLDLKDEYIRLAKEKGIKFAINTDAHSINHLHFMEFGVSQARRAWCEKKDIINTLSLKKFLELIKKSKEKRF